jgi:hypothetical protein
VFGGVLERGIEGNPHSNPDESHDKDRYGRRNDALASFVTGGGPTVVLGLADGHWWSFRS